MRYTQDQMVRVVRNALEGVLHHHPHPFTCHLPSGHPDVEAFKDYFRRTAAIATYVREEDKEIARYVELLDDPEREEVFEAALAIYRAPAMA